MLNEKLRLVQRLKSIEQEIRKIDSSWDFFGNSFQRLGKLRQESVDIKRKIKKDNLVLLLLKLAAIDPNIWQTIEISKIKPINEGEIDQEIFDNIFEKNIK